MMAVSEVSREFVLGPSNAAPAGVRCFRFDALALAEGEWSPTCKRLGVTKTVDRFATAIGLVINMRVDPDCKTTKNFRSFVRILGGELQTLKENGIDCENLEYLKGETHYIATCVKKKSLLELGVLRKDLATEQLLKPANVDLNALMQLGRTVADCVRLPPSTEFCDFHPVKLFDFSTRARCLTPFRVLGVSSLAEREPLCMDLEAVNTLSAAQLAWLRDEAAKFEDELSQATLQARTYATAIDASRADLHAVTGNSASDQDQRARLEAELSVLQAGQAAVLHTQTRVQSKFEARHQNLCEFERNLKAFGGAHSLVPVFPIGDSLLEPFWPQGLGSNRGFHSALDACWAIQTLRTETLEQALLERGFAFDVMITAPMGFHESIIQPGFGWTADICTRYMPDVIQSVVRTYDDPHSKRMKKGRAAVPPRYLQSAAALKQIQQQQQQWRQPTAEDYSA
mmetsp:Transcript_25558/g.64966  ORF Transcript_25558/g.64966 Transcript_25558/m.64966 type:complete len:456 (-) Transcript_25558:303-1670(-)